MQTSKQEVDSEIGEKNRSNADNRQPGNTAARPSPGKAGMEGQGIDKPGNDRPGLLGIPAPVGTPGLIGPDRTGDDPGRKPHKAENNGLVGQVINHLESR